MRRRIVSVCVSEGAYLFEPNGDIYRVGVDEHARYKGEYASHLMYIGNMIDGMKHMFGKNRSAKRRKA